MEAKDKVAIVNRYVAAFGNSDIEVIRDIYAQNSTLEDPAGADPIVGRDAICEFYQVAFSVGVKLTLTGNPRCAGNYVSFPFTVVTPDMGFEAIDLFEFNEQGKIIAMQAFWGPENMIG
jgi:steroid delta-isomerase